MVFFFGKFFFFFNHFMTWLKRLNFKSCRILYTSSGLVSNTEGGPCDACLVPLSGFGQMTEEPNTLEALHTSQHCSWPPPRFRCWRGKLRGRVRAEGNLCPAVVHYQVSLKEAQEDPTITFDTCIQNWDACLGDHVSRSMGMLQ